MSRTNKRRSVFCPHCRHYFITWEQDHPYGCHAMNFKSAHMPSIDVLNASGNPCLNFSEKQHGTNTPRTQSHHMEENRSGTRRKTWIV
ncbi:uracil-DNA glycosylase [Magnetococcales bacterium HHB-1]